MTAATKKAAVQRKSPAKKAVTESSDSEGKVVNLLPTPDAAAAKANPSPYPKGVGVWAYQPNDANAEPILLPLSGFQPSNKLWHFDLAQLPILAQTWRWMDRANVPKHIQRQAQMLEDAEYFAMFNQWFDAMKAAPKGAVTAGK